MTTATAHDFVQAILAEPGDDDVRLVYADFLDDEAGEMTERAEFIRVQCELATLPRFDGVSVIGKARPSRKPMMDYAASSPFDLEACEFKMFVTGLISREDFGKISRRPLPGEVGGLSTDMSFPLRFNGQEAPAAVLDEARACVSRSDQISARFMLLPVVEGDQVILYRPINDRRERLEKRERELLAAGINGFLTAGMPQFGSPAKAEVTWHRGFVSSIQTDSASWLAHGPTVARLQPLESVTLSDWQVVAFQDPSNFEMDQFVMFPEATLPHSPAHTLDDQLSSRGWIQTLGKDAASALATFSRTLILWARAQPAG